ISFNKLLLSNPFVTPSFMVKRDLNIRFDRNSRYAEVFLFLLTLASEGHIVAYLGCPLVRVYKEYGASGTSQNLVKMRIGDLYNYLTLWRRGKIGLLKLILMVSYSSFKFLIQKLIGPHRHEALTSWLNKSQLRGISSR
ncbi:MAG: hypothetical protein NWR09_10515, partial [Pseudomonadales bacterium]|nr:hypothetical protein [Pseudomonadales bacterium]